MTEERFRPDPDKVTAMIELLDAFNADLADEYRIDPKVREDLAHFIVGVLAL